MGHINLIALLATGCFLIPATSAKESKVIREPATSADIALANRLWKICTKEDENGDTPDFRQDNDDDIFCANFLHDQTINVNHNPYRLGRTGAAKGNQYIVIDPPLTTFNHKVKLQGDRSAGKKLTVFVLPPKRNHELKVDDKTTSDDKPQKPKVVFLPFPKQKPGQGVAFFPPKTANANLASVTVDADSGEADEGEGTAPVPQLAEFAKSQEEETEKDQEVSATEDNFSVVDGETEAQFRPLVDGEKVFRLGSGARMTYSI